MVWKRFADDYETVVTVDDEGREKKTAVYRGRYYEVPLDEDGILRFRRICILLLVVTVFLHVGGGFVGNLGMYLFYVALPYVLAFFPMIYLAFGVFRLPREKRAYRREEIGLSFDRMKSSSIVLLIFLGLTVLGEIGFLLLVPAIDQRLLEYIYLALEMISFATVYLLFQFQSKVHIKTSEE